MFYSVLQCPFPFPFRFSVTHVCFSGTTLPTLKTPTVWLHLGGTLSSVAQTRSAALFSSVTTGSPQEHWGQRGGYLLKALLCDSRRAASIPAPVRVQQPLGTQPCGTRTSGFVPPASVSEPPRPGVTLSLPLSPGLSSHFLHCVQVGKEFNRWQGPGKNISLAGI